jgi:hypothetical protein
VGKKNFTQVQSAKLNTILLPPFHTQLRDAYRKKGWMLAKADQLEQCKHDVYLQAVAEQKGEGCRMWGSMKVIQECRVVGFQGS